MSQLLRLNAPDGATESYKFVVTGQSDVGKTSLVKRLVEESFPESPDQTTCVEFYTTMITVDDRHVRLQIWDTAGREDLRSTMRSCYRSAAGVLIVFSVVDRGSFEQLQTFVDDLKGTCDGAVARTLVGTKSDLEDQRTVTVREAEAFASSHGMPYVETSAKTGANVRDAFVRTVASVQDRVEVPVDGPGGRSALRGSLFGHKERERCCC
jgi:Ras-related protein Rab-2A